MYPGETIVDAAGFPALTRLTLGQPGKPLVAFITGGGVLARVAYGAPDCNPRDFLFHWLKEEGFSALGLSYPIDNAVFDGSHPRFGMTDWAEQCAEVIAGTVTERALPRRVILLGWSMAGRIARPLTAALRRRDVEVELFAAMAASPPLPNLLPGLAGLRPAETGLARISGAFQDWLLQCLCEQGALEGRQIMAPARFAAECMGDFPIGLAASAMRWVEGAFVADPAADARETGASDYAGFPMLAVMTHGSARDARHALSDRASWGFYITQSLIERHLVAHRQDFTTLPPQRWRQALDLVHGASSRLSVELPGNHMFFVGETGARNAAAALARLRLEADHLLRDLDAVLG